MSSSISKTYEAKFPVASVVSLRPSDGEEASSPEVSTGSLAPLSLERNASFDSRARSHSEVLSAAEPATWQADDANEPSVLREAPQAPPATGINVPRGFAVLKAALTRRAEPLARDLARAQLKRDIEQADSSILEMSAGIDAMDPRQAYPAHAGPDADSFSDPEALMSTADNLATRRHDLEAAKDKRIQLGLAWRRDFPTESIPGLERKVLTARFEVLDADIAACQARIDKQMAETARGTAPGGGQFAGLLGAGNNWFTDELNEKMEKLQIARARQATVWRHDFPLEDIPGNGRKVLQGRIEMTGKEISNLRKVIGKAAANSQPLPNAAALNAELSLKEAAMTQLVAAWTRDFPRRAVPKH